MAAPFGGLIPSPWVGVFYVALLLVACISDLRTRRIPNALVVVIALCGIGVAIFSQGWIAGGERSLAGLATGLALWLPFWLLRMMGGGDVKLFAAGAAWLGPAGALEGALLAAFCGGILSFVYVLLRYGVGSTLIRVAQSVRNPEVLRESAPTKWDRRMPYGLAMSAGLLLAAWHPGSLF